MRPRHEACGIANLRPEKSLSERCIVPCPLYPPYPCPVSVPVSVAPDHGVLSCGRGPGRQVHRGRVHRPRRQPPPRGARVPHAAVKTKRNACPRDEEKRPSSALARSFLCPFFRLCPVCPSASMLFFSISGYHTQGISTRCEELFDLLNYGPLDKFFKEVGSQATRLFPPSSSLLSSLVPPARPGAPRGKQHPAPIKLLHLFFFRTAPLRAPRRTAAAPRSSTTRTSWSGSSRGSSRRAHPTQPDPTRPGLTRPNRKTEVISYGYSIIRGKEISDGFISPCLRSA